MSSLVSTGIVNWVTTADGCFHTVDADATKQFRPVGIGGVYWALESIQQSNSTSVSSGVWTRETKWRHQTIINTIITQHRVPS